MMTGSSPYLGREIGPGDNDNDNERKMTTDSGPNIMGKRLDGRPSRFWREGYLYFVTENSRCWTKGQNDTVTGI